MRRRPRRSPANDGGVIQRVVERIHIERIHIERIHVQRAYVPACRTSRSTGPAELTAAIDKIEAKAQYESTDWGYIAIDQKTGEVLASQNPDKMFDPGSTMKGFSVSAALRCLRARPPRS